ncbi:MAG TPA: hypothetical protein VGH54_09620 [Mycobacterium sp.]|uniref:hypothetical protein n=1 Tax=Mycobacterium sp. TaxID=1785 RepID=UPI002F427C08
MVDHARRLPVRAEPRRRLQAEGEAAVSLFAREPKHQHAWKVAGGRYEPPVGRSFEVERISDQMLREMIYGVTTITQECTGCGWVATSREIGRVDLSKYGLRWRQELGALADNG